MNLNETVLQKLTDWRPEQPGRHILAIPDEGSGWSEAVTADRNDELGCLVWEMTARRTGPPADGGAAALQAWAERCASRVTGLLEPLKVHEVDSLRNEAQLRSERPTERGQAVLYYEVFLKGTTEAILRRYQASHDLSKTREQIAFPLTHEALAKLVDDLASVP